MVGANDNDGYTTSSNLDPHIVMDGEVTEAAEPRGFESVEFFGTSSSGPRAAGYAAQLLVGLRRSLGLGDGMVGTSLIQLSQPEAGPKTGPVSDGKLTSAELHEVIRKTADPNPHASRWDGGKGSQTIPQPTPLPFAFYPKMGYGEVSEHTIDAAAQVVLGLKPMPSRPNEDRFYAASETIRQTYWG